MLLISSLQCCHFSLVQIVPYHPRLLSTKQYYCPPYQVSNNIVDHQELQNLIDEANQSLEESGTPSHEIMVIVLHREYGSAGTIGITLAGGADYESKEITVSRG